MTEPILCPADETVIRYLLDHGGEDLAEIADGTGLSDDQVRFSLANLQELGYITKRPPGEDLI